MADFTPAADADTPDSSSPVTRHSALVTVLRLTRKELSEILRDRRTIITLVAMPLLLYPLLSVAFQQFFLASRLDQDRGAEYHFGFATEAEAQLLFFRLSQGETELQQRQQAPAKPVVPT